MSHAGYALRHGLIHRRLLILSPNGRELRGEDMLLPAPRARRKGAKGAKGAKGFTMRFHLGRNISASLTADKLGALLRVGGGPLWQFRTSEGVLEIEQSLWVDGEGRPHPTDKLVVTGNGPG